MKRLNSMPIITSFIVLWSSLFSNYVAADYVEGFPEGCYFASIVNPLPDQDLRYGVIRWRDGRPVFLYPDRYRDAFLEADIAENVGKMGFDWRADQSQELMYATSFDKYVVAQIMYRDDVGLVPIVTCISQVFSGTVVYGRMPYRSDYYAEFTRIKDFRWDTGRTNRWDRWRDSWRTKWRPNYRNWLHKAFKNRPRHDDRKPYRPIRDRDGFDKDKVRRPILDRRDDRDDMRRPHRPIIDRPNDSDKGQRPITILPAPDRNGGSPHRPITIRPMVDRNISRPERDKNDDARRRPLIHINVDRRNDDGKGPPPKFKLRIEQSDDAGPGRESKARTAIQRDDEDKKPMRRVRG